MRNNKIKLFIGNFFFIIPCFFITFFSLSVSDHSFENFFASKGKFNFSKNSNESGEEYFVNEAYGYDWLLDIFKGKEDRLENFFLVDRVLSLIKSHYVDSEIVNNEFILSRLLVFVKKKQNNLLVNFSEKKWYISHTIKGSVVFDASNYDTYDLVKFILEVSSLLENHKTSYKDALTATVNSILSSLDRHTTLLSKAEYRELKEGTEGRFGGLGVLVGVRNRILTVLKAIPESPAMAVGIKSGDKILSINGMSTYGFSIDELVEYMRGDPGSIAQLSLLSEDDLSPRVIQVKREIINVKSVEREDIISKNNAILFIKIDSFSMQTAADVRTSFDEFKSKYGKINGLIIDLRFNPGGLLDQSVKVSDLFLKESLIVSTKGLMDEYQYASQYTGDTDVPIIILLDEESASASEILAGSLKDNDRALILGQKSFGKGSVQTIVEMPDELALKLTVARYYTPGGYSIQDVGIDPDILLYSISNKNENINLLSSSLHHVYKESFISSREDDSLQLSNKSKNQQILYYVKKPKKMKENESDIEKNLSVQILREANKFFLEKKIEDFSRSNLISTVNLSKKIRANISSLADETHQFLNDNFNIEWSNNFDHFSSLQNDSVTIQSVFVDKEIYNRGDLLNINFQIFNPTQSDAERVSILAKIRGLNFAMYEILLGKVKKGEVKNGKIELKLPNINSSTPAVIDVGLLFSGVWNKKSIKTIAIDFQEKQMAEIAADIRLVSEHGGKVLGKLEAKEYAKLAISVTNSSQVEMKDVSVEVLNLAGKQIALGERQKLIPWISPGRSEVIHVEILGGRSLVSKKIPLGVYIDSSDIMKPQKDVMFIDGLID